RAAHRIDHRRGAPGRGARAGRARWRVHALACRGRGTDGSPLSLEATVLETAEEVAAAAAGEIAAAVGSGAARTLVLAGGSTPRRCAELRAGTAVGGGRVTFR